MKLLSVDHIAIICSNYEISKKFYVEVLGLEILHEAYRKERLSYKLDLGLGGKPVIELFTFPDPPKRPSQPEALGLRHLAFEVANVETAVKDLTNLGVETEEIRNDEYTGKKFVFFRDPDDLPIELYETRA